MNDRPVLGRRVWHGWPLGPTVTLEARSSLLVVGPTQAGKTSSLVLPALLRWSDAAVVTSVKGDVVRASVQWRRAIGEVQILEPGRDGGLTWNPLEGVTTLRHALRVARDLTLASDRGDGEFWNALATKLVGALMTMALERGASIFDVAAVVASHDVGRWLDARRPTPAAEIVAGMLRHDPKTLDGVLTTAEAMLVPWQFPQPLAEVRRVLSGAHTLYLCSPRGEQRHYEPLFRGAIRRVLEEQQRRSDEGTARRLLMILDEAATVASLDELDQLAATVSGLGVTLVTVVQDFAQLAARWGERAATIVNNHTTRVVVAGLADPALERYLPEVTATSGEGPPLPLRRRPRGTAVVVRGSRPVHVLRMRPWWRYRRLRPRGERVE